MTDWFAQSWSYIVPWAACLAAVIIAVRSAYAAERDRTALRDANLQREKLLLEIERLRNSPEVVAERRAIYDRLRGALGAIIGAGDVSTTQVGLIYEVLHDSRFRFPPEITDFIATVAESVMALYRTGRSLEYRSPSNSEKWTAVAKENSDAMQRILTFQTGLAERFRPYLSL